MRALTPWLRMVASGSTEGSEKGRSPVATVFTQSVEPGIGTSSTLMPALAYQASLVALAKGEAAELTVRAHQPTRSLVSSAAWALTPDAATASTKPMTHRASLLLRVLPFPAPGRTLPSPTHPRTARAGESIRRCR